MNSYRISYFKPYKAGVYKMGLNGSNKGDGIAFAFDAENLLNKYKEIGVVVYKEDKTIKFPFDLSNKTGSVFGLCIENISTDKEKLKYDFYADELIIHDKYAVAFTDNKDFGHYEETKSLYVNDCFDWENDKNPNIPYENSFFYGLNVRGFTKHKSSKVKARGCFEGIVEKIPYLIDLGVTSIVLMPAYEFDECEYLNKVNQKPLNVDEASKQSKALNKVGKINCWGYTKGYYYAPKNSFAYNDNPVTSFKYMVKKMHENNIEVMMHFYFPKECLQSDIIDILRFWVNEYHIDGFRISGFNIPSRMIINDPLLKSVKLWFNYLPYEEIEDYQIFDQKSLAVDNGNFRYDIRKFLKSDEGLINSFISYHKANPNKLAVINYICDYDGFTLSDLYSYERKHNEDNGEDNLDGNNENYSWNCGIEGETRKKYITNLRLKQIKNALTLLFICQGTPYLFSGDEMGNSRGGNNNTYCQDNDKGYVIWKDNAYNSQILEFAKSIINFRMNNRIMHMCSELTNMDNLNLGYPDLSYHGIEAWRPELQFNSRILGMYFNGKYAHIKNEKSFYIGINMHWEKHRLAVPKLKKGQSYKKVIDTSLNEGDSKDNEIPLGERSIAIYEVVE